MIIAVLSRDAALYSTRRLLDVGSKRGHIMKIIDHMRCYIDITADSPRLIYQGQPLTDIDAVIPRIGASYTFYGTAVVRQFEMMGVLSANGSEAISRSRDKLRCLQLLSKEGVGLPVTGFAHSTKDIEGVIERCLVVNNQAVASMKRQGAPGEFRSIIHRGGTVKRTRLSLQERDTAVRAAKAMGLKVAGVDLLRASQGPVVIEVNSSPGLEGIERATDIDVASKIIEYLERERSLNK